MSAIQENEQLGQAVGASSEAPAVRPADWWRRAAALVIDIAVLWIPLTFLTREMERPVQFVVGVAVGMTYFGLLNGGRRGQTVGKMVWDIRVRDTATGGPLGLPKAALRHLVPSVIVAIPILGLVLWLLDGLWPLWDRRRQALHDKLAGSQVVPAH